MADAARPLPPRPSTLDEFIAWDEAQDDRHEYRRGVIRMMTGGTLRNTRIAQNIARVLNAKLAGGPCFAYVENVRVKLALADAGYYPDVVVDCGPYNPGALAAVTPTVVFEILSLTTRDRDFSEKVPDYRDTQSIRQIVLVEPDERLAHVWTETDGRWRQSEARGSDGMIRLPALSLELPLADVYAGA